MFTDLIWDIETYQSTFLTSSVSEEAGVADRQDRLPNFSTTALRQATVVIIGAGGLGGQIGASLCRKGIGHLILADADQVELSNLARQVFYEKDLHRNKALALAENLSRESFLGTKVTGHAVDFNQETASALAAGADVVCCGVDNNFTRLQVSRYCGLHGIPAVFTAVNENADFTWVYLQNGVTPCIGCVFPQMRGDLLKREPCVVVPSLIDILKVSAALVCHAVDFVLMKQTPTWTYADFHLSGGGITDEPKAGDGCVVCRPVLNRKRTTRRARRRWLPWKKKSGS